MSDKCPLCGGQLACASRRDGTRQVIWVKLDWETPWTDDIEARVELATRTAERDEARKQAEIVEEALRISVDSERDESIGHWIHAILTSCPDEYRFEWCDNPAATAAIAYALAEAAWEEAHKGGDA